MTVDIIVKNFYGVNMDTIIINVILISKYSLKWVMKTPEVWRDFHVSPAVLFDHNPGQNQSVSSPTSTRASIGNTFWHSNP